MESTLLDAAVVMESAGTKDMPIIMSTVKLVQTRSGLSIAETNHRKYTGSNSEVPILMYLNSLNMVVCVATDTVQFIEYYTPSGSMTFGCVVKTERYSIKGEIGKLVVVL